MRNAIDSPMFILLLLFSSIVGFGQINFEESNWHKEIGRFDDSYSRFDLTRYTKEDVETAKAKFLRIASAKPSDEWTGSYRRQTMLGSAEITWDGDNGYVYAYVYHTLANLGYGRVELIGDSIRFVSERGATSNRSYSFETEFIRVKFGERHVLVPKDRLAEFAVWAAGREVPTGARVKEIYTEDGFFWEKIEDEKKPIAEIPTFPNAYTHLIRQPIQAKILAVGPLRIRRETSAQWGTTTIDHLRRVTLSAGRNQGVKVGMQFWIDGLEEWVEITSVTATRSRAKLKRPYIAGREYCSTYANYKLVEFTCRDPKVNSTARTRVDYF